VTRALREQLRNSKLSRAAQKGFPGEVLEQHLLYEITLLRSSKLSWLCEGSAWSACRVARITLHYPQAP